MPQTINSAARSTSFNQGEVILEGGYQLIHILVIAILGAFFGIGGLVCLAMPDLNNIAWVVISIICFTGSAFYVVGIFLLKPQEKLRFTKPNITISEVKKYLYQNGYHSLVLKNGAQKYGAPDNHLISDCIRDGYYPFTGDIRIINR